MGALLWMCLIWCLTLNILLYLSSVQLSVNLRMDTRHMLISDWSTCPRFVDLGEHEFVYCIGTSTFAVRLICATKM